MPTHFDGNEEERRALDLFIKLSRASESILERTECPIAQAGLTPSQFGVLETLYHLGPMMPSQLADKHLKSRNNFTIVIDNLEKRGLVTRCRGAQDRRSVLVSLTDAGKQKIETLFPAFVAGMVREMSVLTTEEQEQLAGLLRILGKGHR